MASRSGNLTIWGLVKLAGWLILRLPLTTNAKQMRLALLLCCWGPLLMWGQHTNPMEWGVIDPVDLAMTTYEFDSTAQALVLDEYASVTVEYNSNGTTYKMEVHQRIKILSEDAVETYSDVAIPYVHEDNQEQILFGRAQTIHPDGTITELNLRKDAFKEEYNEYMSLYKFSFANVAVGSVLEYSYVRKSSLIFRPYPWNFRRDIPVRRSAYQFINQSPYSYRYYLQGTEYLPYMGETNGKEIFRLDEMQLTIDGTYFQVDHAAKLEEEPYITTLNDYTLRLRFQLAGNDAVAGSSLYESWEQAAYALHNKEDFGLRYRRSRQAKDLIEASEDYVSAGAPERERIYQVHQFLTTSTTWTGGRGILADLRMDEAFEKGIVDLPELQMMGIALLRHYGLEAYPALTSTRDNGGVITLYPFMNQFNYIFVAIRLAEDQWQFVDFSSPYLYPGLVRREALNHLAFVVQDEEPVWLHLQVPAFQNFLNLVGAVRVDGQMEASMRVIHRGYKAIADRRAINEQPVEAWWAEYLPSECQLTNLQVLSEEDRRTPYQIEADIVLPVGFANGDLLYFSPFVDFPFQESPFKRETRVFPVDFPYPLDEKQVYRLNIPEGYEVESLPEELLIQLLDEAGSFQFLCQAKSGQLQLMIWLRLNDTFFPPGEYAALRNFFARVEQKLQEQIVLRKAS